MLSKFAANLIFIYHIATIEDRFFLFLLFFGGIMCRCADIPIAGKVEKVILAKYTNFSGKILISTAFTRMAKQLFSIHYSRFTKLYYFCPLIFYNCYV